MEVTSSQRVARSMAHSFALLRSHGGRTLPSPLQESQSLTGVAFHVVEYIADATQVLRSKSWCRCRTHSTFGRGSTQAGGNRFL